MNLLRGLWDFIFGVILIAGAPFLPGGILLIPLDLLWPHPHGSMADMVGGAVSILTLLGGVTAFGYAIQYRSRHRVLPKYFIVGEILLGVVGAFLFFSYYGVLSYSIIG